MDKTISSVPAVALAITAAMLSLGCGKGENAFPTVNLDANEIAAQIMAEYDANGDGEMSAAELKKNSGLEMLTAGEANMQQEYRLDSDGSGTTSEAEFAAKLKACFESDRQSFHCTVLYKKRPLEGATVTLVPESFMGDGIPQATGETDVAGQCAVTGEDGLTGTYPGIYRVEITHPDKKISSKYNTESKLSVALDTTNPYIPVPKFNVN